MDPGFHCFTADQRFWIAATTRARYSHGSIICGKPAHPARDNQATTNPVVVVEVLSPSSEGDDDGDKRRDFQSRTSMRPCGTALARTIRTLGDARASRGTETATRVAASV